ncbi:28S ribosomal protein S15, mitochondrial [Harpegnathos saltator]|uniref:Small ribosomal subunit protein uS15m n=1 Tax=Harpegnathos saltator TaxID=610380 RepID=E2BLF7_HARSA|nr:28S ribosomal protein S15, mitochondrial [Harpegnathos saltator]EFN83509.1 28S ribosomal protein S15, mitochondrial [Harpegnathos saltator]
MTSVMLNNCKRATRITASLLKSGDNLAKRRYATLEDYKITWTRPEKVSPLSPQKSGDQGIDVDVKESDMPEIYRESPEMKDASEIVKRMFTLKFLPLKATNDVMKTKIVNRVRRYNSDVLSPEVGVAKCTTKILRFRKLYEKNPTNGRIKTILKESIDQRRHQLAKLRKLDYRCFEYTLEKLNLVYKPRPELPTQIAKKESLTRLTEKHCNKIVQEKLDAYRVELKMQQKNFYIEKAEKLAFIRKEEIECGLEPTVSEEDVARAKQKAMEYQT